MSAADQLPLREHDLPVSWDGAPVTWDPWEDGRRGAVVFICPPPKPRACAGCRSLAPARRAVGRTDPGADLGTVRRLFAFRCPDCDLDEVWDMATDEWWTLGPEDYGDGGSVPPAVQNSAAAAGEDRAAAIARARQAVADARDQAGLF